MPNSVFQLLLSIHLAWSYSAASHISDVESLQVLNWYTAAHMQKDVHTETWLEKQCTVKHSAVSKIILMTSPLFKF